MATVSEENKAAAAVLKGKANEAFKNKNFMDAAKLYGAALEKNDQDATIWCNRAFARMNLEEYGYALDDATKAIALDPKYVKAYYRRALCYLSILKNAQAIADFKKTLALDPQNAIARKQLEATQKLQRRIEFEKAIEVEDEETPVERVMDSIQHGGCEIDAAYAGPRLPPASETDAAKGKKYGIDLDFIGKMEEWFKAGKYLARRVVWEIVLGCFEACVQEESLHEVVLQEGMTCDVIGDTHGQYYDLLHLLTLTGKPSEKRCLLFNGDFVDRGSWSVEVVLTLMAWKWLLPRSVYLNRGNHETKDMNKVYGFEGEVKHKHGELTYKLFSHVFTALPLATLISPALVPTPKALASAVAKGQAPILSPEGRMRYFVTHGGLFSKDNVTLDDIRAIPRIGKQPGNEGLMCELLWTDPQEEAGRGPSKRGVGIGFGPDVTRRWCTLNGITGILRSHEVRQGGYAIEHDGLCTTVFSAPNYVDQSGNKGAYVRIDSHGEREYTTYDAVPHPPMKPMAYAGAMGMIFAFLLIPVLAITFKVDLIPMEVDGPEQLLAKPSPIAAIFRPPSPPHSRSYENMKRASLSSQVSSRRSSNSKRRRVDAHRKSDASSYIDRRGSHPVVNFRPLDHPSNSAPEQPASALPNYDPRIYDQLSTFTFGAPPGSSAPQAAGAPTFSSSVPQSVPTTQRRSYSQSADDTDASVEEIDEEEQLREERAKLRAMGDGSRRPSLPINYPPGTERRRSTIFRITNGLDNAHMDGVPEERGNESTLLSQLSPKPLPALPLLPFHALQAQANFLPLPRQELRSQLEASAAGGVYDISYNMEPDSDAGSPKMDSEASNAPSPQANADDARESSPSGGVMESAGFQAILDHEWGTAFHIPADMSPRGSIIEDPFMKMVEQFDPVYNRNKYAWTFKKQPTLKKQPNGAAELRTASEPPDGVPSSLAKGKEREQDPEKEQPEVVMWSCQNVGQYGMWPGRSTANGEHRRPSVLYAVSGEGSKRRGPTYLIHKHSRCHAFSIFQGYQVTGQKILASHAMLLSNKAIQYSFANSPEHRSSNKNQKNHEPYEDDPDVMKLQTHQLVDEEPGTNRPYRNHSLAEAVTGSPKPAAKRRSSTTPDRTLSRKSSNDLLRQQPRMPSVPPMEEEKSGMDTQVDQESSVNSAASTLTPVPRVTSHADAFESMDHTMASHALNRASSTRFEWFRKAFGTGKPVGTAPRYAGNNVLPTATSIDSAYSPPWLLMAPQSVKQEEERIIQHLNDSFRAVGLIPQPKVRPVSGHGPKPRKSKPRSAIIDSIPRDAMMMLMPLWIAEGGSAAGVSKHHVPMTERMYLLVYYVPFDSSSKPGESSRSVASKKRTRRDRDRSDRKKSPSTSDRMMLSSTLEEVPPVPPLPDATPKKPKKCSFRVVARMLNYADVRESGIKLPRFGLAVHGPLSDALVGNPTYHAVGENYSAVIAVCHGAESGMELVTEGLDKLGLRRIKRGLADEQQIALGAMEMDAGAMEEEWEARQQPLTPIGKSVVEMIFAGCVSILEVGFR